MLALKSALSFESRSLLASFRMMFFSMMSPLTMTSTVLIFPIPDHLLIYEPQLNMK